MPGLIPESDMNNPPTASVARIHQGTFGKLASTPMGLFSLVLVGAMVTTALTTELIAPGNPFATEAGRALRPPSSQFWFGTDDIGRDLFTGVIHGVRTSVTVVVWVVAISGAIGITLGLACGYLRGLVDTVIMRVTEVFQIVPRFFLAILVISFFGRGLELLILLLGLTSWTFLARVVRAETIRLRDREFVEAARAMGSTRRGVIRRHLLPNIVPPVIVVIALFASRVIMIEAGLAFLGLSDPNRISLGQLANNAQQFLRLAWWLAFFPGVAILVAVLGLNLLSDSLNRAQRIGG
ncbi:MAG: ABC transporter permease [Acidimicrobiales bacterium]